MDVGAYSTAFNTLDQPTRGTILSAPSTLPISSTFRSRTWISTTAARSSSMRAGSSKRSSPAAAADSAIELNGLFAALLRELGFQVTLLSAGVANARRIRPRVRPPCLARRPRPPLPRRRRFRRLLPGSPRRWTNWKKKCGYRILFHQGKPQYRFTLAARRLQDYAGMCRYHQTSPASSFTRNRLITQATPEGRITLSDTSFVVTRNGVREERPVSGPEEFNALYEQHFRASAKSAP